MPISASLQNWYNAQTPGAPKTPGLLAASDPSTYNPSTYDATTYDPTTLTSANKWEVAPEQTVQKQLENVVNTDSPLQQQARTSALQQANERGLLNSSIAVGAAQDSVIKSALPIATQDATTYGNASKFNAESANTFDVKNADIQNAAKNYGANQINEANRYNAEAYTNAGKYTSDVYNARQTAEKSVQAQTARDAALAGYNTRSAQFDADVATQKAAQLYGYDTATAGRLAETQKQQALFKANMEASLAQINNEAQFDQHSQAIYGGLSQDFAKTIQAINQDTNMNQQSKDYAIKQQYDLYRAQISMLGAVGSVPDVSRLLGGGSTGATGLTGATGATGAAGSSAAPAPVAPLKLTAAQLPQSFQPGLTKDPKWEALIAQAQRDHQARFGQPLTRSPSADADAARAYQNLVNQYMAA